MAASIIGSTENQLNVILSILILVILGCACPPPSERRTTRQDAPESPRPATSDRMSVNLIELLGKSRKDVEKKLGKAKGCDPIRNPKDGQESCDYAVEGATNFWFYYRNGKANFFLYQTETKGADTPLEFARWMNFDLRNETPIRANDLEVTYRGTINGRNYQDITISKLSNGWSSMKIRLDP